MYHYKTLEIENAILFGSKICLKNFMAILIYLNLFICFLASYALNVRYTCLMKASSYVIFIAGIIGSYAIIHFKRKDISVLDTDLNFGIISNTKLAFLLFRYSGNNMPNVARSYFIEQYTNLANYFLLGESISLAIEFIIFMVILLIKYMKAEEKISETPTIVTEETVGLDALSLRNKIVYK